MCVIDTLRDATEYLNLTIIFYLLFVTLRIYYLSEKGCEFMDYYCNSELLDNLVAKYQDKSGVPILLGTHNGEFHSDDVLSTAMLQHALESRRVVSRVVRTRNPEFLAGCDIVYDVGCGIYDHHGDCKVYYPNGIMMASCGKLLKDLIADTEVLEYLRSRLFYAVEAIDNGQTLPVYMNSSMISFVKQFNPPWDHREDKQQLDKLFFEVVGMVRKIYERLLINAAASIEAKHYVEKNAIIKADGRIMILPKYCYVKDYIRTHNELLVIVYPSEDQVFVKCVSSLGRGFDTRVTFPEEWCGKSKDALAKISGINDIVFCHPAGHMAIFNSPESARKACEVLLKRKEEFDMQCMQIHQEE